MQNATAPRIAVIITMLGRHEDVIRAVASVRASTTPPAAVYVIDNSADEAHAAAVREADPEVRLLRMGENAGFVGAYNRGLREAMADGFDYYLALNDDTIVDPPMLAEMSAPMSADPSVGLVGPAIFMMDGERPWSVGCRYDWKAGKPTQRGDEYPYKGSEPYEVDYVNGCAMMFTHAALEEAGLFDNRFFIYYEDTDLSYRIRQSGRRLLVAPRATMRHMVGATTGRNTPFSIYYQTRNRLLFIHKHAPSSTRRWWLIARHSLSRLARGAGKWIRGERAVGRAFIRAVTDYHFGRFGRSETFTPSP